MSITTQMVAGTVIGWGNNPEGGTPVPPGLGDVRVIAAGYAQNLAIRQDGSLAAWGGVNALQLSNLVGVAGGSEHSLALKSDGTVVGWGNNLLGAGVVPDGLRSVVAVGAGFQHSLALRMDGTVASWGCTFSSQCYVPTGVTDLVSIACGGYHSLGLRADGTVIAWDSGQMLPNPGLSNVVLVAAGGYHNLALKRDGSIAIWGTVFEGRDYGQTNIPSGLTNVVALSAGVYHNLAAKADGTVTAWGYNQYGQCNVPAGLSNVISVAAGGFHSLALVGGAHPTNGPLIVRQPVAAPVNAGSRALLSVGVIGTEPILYQWQRNGQPIPGAVTPVLEIPLITANAAGEYSVVVSNSSGTNQSVNAVLEVLIPPAVTLQPDDATIRVGDQAILAAQVEGSPAPFLQWRRNGTPLSGQTNATLVLTNVQTSHAGHYSLLASNLGGITFSSNALLTVSTPAAIRRQPESQSVYVGDTLTLQVAASATSPITYQWSRGGTDLPGATNHTLVLSGVTTNDSGLYQVAIHTAYYTVFSTTATVSVIDSAPVIAPLTNVITFAGGSPQFSIQANGSKPLTYQWLLNGHPIPGETNAELQLTAVTSQAADSYSVVVSNRVGWVVSSAASLVFVDVTAWGYILQGDYPVFVHDLLQPHLTNIIAVADGGLHSLALTHTGQVLVWGIGTETDVPPGLTNVVAIAAGHSHSLALRDDGQVVAWGDNRLGQTNVPSNLSNVIAIAAGNYHSLALLADGTIRGWGYNASGKIQVPTGLSNVVAIAGGDSYSLALKADGTVVRLASKGGGPITEWSNVVAIAAGGAHSLALTKNGVVLGIGSNNFGQREAPPALDHVVAVAAGRWHSLALKADGSVVAWGWNNHGQTNVPAGLTNVQAISASSTHSLALVGSSPPVAQPTLSGPIRLGNQFQVAISSQSGRVYGLEYADSLSSTNWHPLPLVPGTGRILTLVDSAASGPQRFYRLRRW